MHNFTRPFGRTGIPVSALGLGCSPLAGPSWAGTTPLGRGTVNDAESLRALHCAFDYGVTLLDTADSYGAGHSERIVGKALQSRRSEIFVITKFGNQFNEETRELLGPSSSAEYVRQACEASLRRMQTDYIDCYMFHWNNCNVEAVPAIGEVLDGLVQAGKIRSYGWSTDFTDRARALAKGQACAAIEHQMNVLDDAPAMVATCEELNLASINRGPLAMGLLSGKYSADTLAPNDDVRGKNAPSWMKYFQDGKPSPQWLARVEALGEVLRSDGRSLAQGALAWLWARSPLTLPIPGFKSVSQVEDNCKALDKGPLTDEQMSVIAELISTSQTLG